MTGASRRRFLLRRDAPKAGLQAAPKRPMPARHDAESLPNRVPALQRRVRRARAPSDARPGFSAASVRCCGLSAASRSVASGVCADHAIVAATGSGIWQQGRRRTRERTPTARLSSPRQRPALPVRSPARGNAASGAAHTHTADMDFAAPSGALWRAASGGKGKVGRRGRCAHPAPPGAEPAQLSGCIDDTQQLYVGAGGRRPACARLRLRQGAPRSSIAATASFLSLSKPRPWPGLTPRGHPDFTATAQGRRNILAAAGPTSTPSAPPKPALGFQRSCRSPPRQPAAHRDAAAYAARGDARARLHGAVCAGCVAGALRAPPRV